MNNIQLNFKYAYIFRQDGHLGIFPKYFESDEDAYMNMNFKLNCFFCKDIVAEITDKGIECIVNVITLGNPFDYLRKVIPDASSIYDYAYVFKTKLLESDVDNIMNEHYYYNKPLKYVPTIEGWFKNKTRWIGVGDSYTYMALKKQPEKAIKWNASNFIVQENRYGQNQTSNYS